MGEEYETLLKQLETDRIQYCGKLQILSRLLPEWKSQQNKVLIFSKSTKMLDILEQFLANLRHSYLRYDGSIQVGVKRQKIIDQVCYFSFLLL